MQDINTQNNENELKEKMTPKERTIFILKIAGNVLFYCFILALLLFSIMNINAGSKNGGFPNLFGKGFLSVQTDSMERNDKAEDDVPGWADYKIGEINTGDLIWVNKFSKSDTSSLKVGDVITFFDDELNALNTHRIVAIKSNTLVVTQGDNKAENQPYDSSETPDDVYNGQLDMTGAVENVSVTNIKGVVTGVSRGAGKVMDNIHQNWLWYFVIPVLAFLLFEVFMVVRNIMELKGAKQKAEMATDKEAMLSEVEAMKEEMRKQLLAELGLQQNATVAPAVVEETPVAEETPSEDVAQEQSAVEEVVESPVNEEVSIIEEQPAVEEAVEISENVETEEIVSTIEEQSVIAEPIEDIIIEEASANADIAVQEQSAEEVVEEANEVKKEAVPTEEAKPKKTTTRKSSTSTTKKTTGTTKKTTATGAKKSTASTTKKTSSTGTKKTTTTRKPKAAEAVAEEKEKIEE